MISQSKSRRRDRQSGQWCRGASFSSQWWRSVTANEEKEVCGVNEATPVEQKLLPRKIASLHDMVKEAMKEHSPERRHKPHARGRRVGEEDTVREADASGG